jgi:hypothetical protein
MPLQVVFEGRIIHKTKYFSSKSVDNLEILLLHSGISSVRMDVLTGIAVKRLCVWPVYISVENLCTSGIISFTGASDLLWIALFQSVGCVDNYGGFIEEKWWTSKRWRRLNFGDRFASH